MKTKNEPKILIVEDDASVGNLIKTSMMAHDYQYLVAQNGKSALMMVTSHRPDIMLLDLGLPDMDGIEIIRLVRGFSAMPIIVISARDTDTDKIAALDAGADDYLTKPFSVDELLARIRVTQRHLASVQSDTPEKAVFTSGDLTVDYHAGAAVAGKALHLTPSEFKLLCVLCQNAGKVLSYPFLSKTLWGNEWEENIPSLRVFVATLRKKLAAGNCPRIQTHVGVGYQLIETD